MGAVWSAPRVSVDRMTLLMKIPSLCLYVKELTDTEYKQRFEGMKKFQMVMLHRHNDMLDASFQQGVKTELYSQHYRFKNGADLQIGPRFPVRTRITDDDYIQIWGTKLDQSRGFMDEFYDPEFSVRLEWNPNKTDIRELYFILNQFRTVVNLPASEFLKVSRMDIAIDYPFNLDPLLTSCRGLRSGGLFWGSNGEPETLYMGSGSSSFYFRFYNKRKEILSRENRLMGKYSRELEEYEFHRKNGVQTPEPVKPDFEEIPEHLWRLEMEYKNPFFLSDYFPSDIHERFLRVDMFAGSEMHDDWKLQLLIHLVKAWGLKAAMSYLPSTTRKRYQEQLRLSLVSHVEHPGEVVSSQLPAIWQTEKNRIMYAFGYEGDKLKL